MTYSEPFAWITPESANRLKRGGNVKGSVPVHRTPSSTANIPVYTTPSGDSGLARALEIVRTEISRAEALMVLEEGGRPVFDRAQTEAGIFALRAVAAVLEAEHKAE